VGRGESGHAEGADPRTSTHMRVCVWACSLTERLYIYTNKQTNKHKYIQCGHIARRVSCERLLCVCGVCTALCLYRLPSILMPTAATSKAHARVPACTEIIYIYVCACLDVCDNNNDTGQHAVIAFLSRSHALSYTHLYIYIYIYRCVCVCMRAYACEEDELQRASGGHRVKCALRSCWAPHGAQYTYTYL
jgi:hypothetical protein